MVSPLIEDGHSLRPHSTQLRHKRNLPAANSDFWLWQLQGSQAHVHMCHRPSPDLDSFRLYIPTRPSDTGRSVCPHLHHRRLPPLPPRSGTPHSWTMRMVCFSAFSPFFSGLLSRTSPT